MRRSRPSRHLRRVHTKRGVKKIIINPTIRKRRKNYGSTPRYSYEYNDLLKKNIKYRPVADGFLREPIGLSVEEQGRIAREDAIQQFKSEYGRDPESMIEVFKKQMAKSKSYVKIPKGYDLSNLDLPMALASEGAEYSFAVDEDDVNLISSELKKRRIPYEWE